MNAKEIDCFIKKNIKYKKGWRFVVGTKGDALFLQIVFKAKCNVTGLMKPQHCRKFMLSEHMTVTEIVQSCFTAVRQAELHEAAEMFKYKGQDIFNRHVSVDNIAHMMSRWGADSFDYRMENNAEVAKHK